MRPTLGATFARYAMEPCERALALMNQQRLEEGFALLGGAALVRAVEEGGARAARRAGVRRDRILDLLDWHELRLIAGLVGACAKQAASAHEEREAARFQSTPADAPAERASAAGPAFDAGDRLRRFARAAADVTATTEVLDLLAAALTRWSDLVTASATLIDDRGSLRAAYGWKWTRRGLAAAGLAALGAWLGWRALDERACDARIEAALAGADPCAVRIPEADAARASGEQRRREADRQAECEEGRRKAAAAQKHRASCVALIEAVEKGRLSADDQAFSGGRALLLGRIAGSALEPRDLLLTAEQLEDGCPENRDRLWRAAIKASSRSSTAWASVEGVSEPLRNALLSSETPLSVDSRRALGLHAEAIAKAAAGSEDPKVLERATKLCDLSRRFGVEAGGWCTGVAILYRRVRRERNESLP